MVSSSGDHTSGAGRHWLSTSTLKLSLLVRVILSKPSSCDLGQLLKLLLSVVEATQMIRVLRYEVRLDWVALANQIKASDLLLEARHDSLRIQDGECVLK